MNGSDKYINAIPAAPGYFVLEAVRDENGEPIALKHPVVGWVVERETLAAVPVTLDGVSDDFFSVLLPDGSVMRPPVEWHEHLDGWLKDEIARKEGRRPA